MMDRNKKHFGGRSCGLQEKVQCGECHFGGAAVAAVVKVNVVIGLQPDRVLGIAATAIVARGESRIIN